MARLHTQNYIRLAAQWKTGGKKYSVQEEEEEERFISNNNNYISHTLYTFELYIQLEKEVNKKCQLIYKFTPNHY